MKSVDLSNSKTRIALALAPHKKQHGVALITAVMIVAIASVIATSIMSRQNFDTQRTGNIIHGDQGRIYALGAENWIGSELKDDAKKNKVDHLKENWALDLPPLPIDGGYIQGSIQDLQGRLNLNSMLDPEQQKRLERLCVSLGVDLKFIPALQDWIDSDSDERNGGAEDLTYLSMDPPYRPGNRAMLHPSELLMVQHMTAKDYERLLPYISALPESTPINVNTAPPQVLQSLVQGATFQEAEQIASNRLESPFDSIEQFTEQAFIGQGLVPKNLTVASQYFLLTTEVELGSAHTVAQTLFYRDEKGVLTTLYRRQGPSREMILRARVIIEESEDDKLEDDTE